MNLYLWLAVAGYVIIGLVMGSALLSYRRIYTKPYSNTLSERSALENATGTIATGIFLAAMITALIANGYVTQGAGIGWGVYTGVTTIIIGFIAMLKVAEIMEQKVLQDH